MAYVIGLDGRVHIHRRFTEDAAEAYCGHRIQPVYRADFVKTWPSHKQQCIQCQDRKYEEGNVVR